MTSFRHLPPQAIRTPTTRPSRTISLGSNARTHRDPVGAGHGVSLVDSFLVRRLVSVVIKLDDSLPAPTPAGARARSHPSPRAAAQGPFARSDGSARE